MPRRVLKMNQLVAGSAVMPENAVGEKAAIAKILNGKCTKLFALNVV